jgi:hypothetical protein
MPQETPPPRDRKKSPPRIPRMSGELRRRKLPGDEQPQVAFPVAPIDRTRTPDDTKRADYHIQTRAQALEVFYASLKVREAGPEDIKAINVIYNKLYYERSAFQLLADKDLCTQLDNSDDPEDENRVSRALKEVSSGGEFAQISEAEWTERMNNLGERVLLMMQGDKIIGVNSYCLGPEAQSVITPRISAIATNDNGDVCKRRLLERSQKVPMSYPHVLQIHDTFFNPDVQGRGLFQRFYERTIDYELSHPDAIITPENLKKWAIYYFVNRFESIFSEKDGESAPLYLGEGIQVNNATIAAGLKFGAQHIGITRSKDLYGEEPTVVPSLEDENDSDLMTIDGLSRIMTRRGYLDMLIPVVAMLREKGLRLK